MVHFVGAGPGAPDLITVRGKQYLEEADVVIYAGSLVNPKLLEYTKDICTIYEIVSLGQKSFIGMCSFFCRYIHIQLCKKKPESPKFYLISGNFALLKKLPLGEVELTVTLQN